jgi:hypothetical protein
MESRPNGVVVVAMTSLRRGLALCALVGAASLAACGGDGPTRTIPGRCPLTGLTPTATQDLDAVAVAVKVDNADEARPQSGLDHADIVVEETVEGGLTRLFAVFQCEVAASVGPVRSARTSDGALLRLLDGAVFAYSGANPKAIAPVEAVSHAVLLPYDDNPSLYHRAPDRSAPHDVFTSTHALAAAGQARDSSLSAPRPVFAYAPAAPAGATPAQSIALQWSGVASAIWSWSGDRWLRSQNGSPDVLTDGTRVDAVNVVVMRIRTKDTGLHDVLGNPSPEDVVTGSGEVSVFRNGKVVTGKWSRPDVASPMTITDAKGHPLPLAPGRTWVELLPSTGTLTVD